LLRTRNLRASGSQLFSNSSSNRVNRVSGFGIPVSVYEDFIQKGGLGPEVDALIADSRKAREKLGWSPKVDFKELVAIMVDADMELAGLKPRGKGRAILEEKLAHWNHWQNSVTRVMQAAKGQASEH